MAYISLNDYVLVDEYCDKPKDKECKGYQVCYHDYWNCPYWKRIFKKLRDTL